MFPLTVIRSYHGFLASRKSEARNGRTDRHTGCNAYCGPLLSRRVASRSVRRVHGELAATAECRWHGPWSPIYTAPLYRTPWFGLRSSDKGRRFPPELGRIHSPPLNPVPSVSPPFPFTSSLLFPVPLPSYPSQIQLLAPQ